MGTKRKPSLQWLIEQARSIADDVEVSLLNLEPDESQAPDNDFSEPLCFAEDLLKACQALMERADELHEPATEESA